MLLYICVIFAGSIILLKFRKQIALDSCWQNDFDEDYLKHIKYYCIIMTKEYIENNFSDIVSYASVIETRGEEALSMEYMIAENQHNLSMCRKYGHTYILIDKNYSIDIDIFKSED